MKFQIQQKDILKIINIVQKCVSPKPQLPSLGGIYFKTKNRKLTIRATDLYVGIDICIDVISEEDGSIVVPAKQFVQILTSAPNDNLEFLVKESRCVVTSLNYKAELVSLASSDFPEFPAVSGKPILISSEVIKKIDQNIISSSSSDPTRPVLNAVLIKLSKEGLVVVCTDGFRLALLSQPFESFDERLLLLPAKAFRNIAKHALEGDIKEVLMNIDDEQKQVLIKVGEYSYYLRLIEGEFPPYEKIIPNEMDVSVKFDAVETFTNLKRASIFGQDNSYVVKFVFDKKEVKICATSSLVGDFEAVLSSSVVVGKVDDVAFSTKYIQEIFQDKEGSTIEFGMSDSLKPVWFRVVDEPSILYVVMPFKITKQ